MKGRLLAGGVAADGSRLDLRVDAVSGLVLDAAPSLALVPGDEQIDLCGMVVLPAAAEPHVHLDKVGTIAEVPNPAGDLLGAIAAWQAHAPSITADDAVHRATEAIDRYVAAGATAVRTHVNVHADIDRSLVEAILQVRADVAGRCDLQVVALVSSPISGGSPTALATLAAAEDALRLGVDVVGGAPATDADPAAAVHRLVDLAERFDCPIDLHSDETLDPAAQSLDVFVAAVAERGWAGRAVASHCVSLSARPIESQRRLADALAAAGVAVAALPPTNLWLQGRDHAVAPPRGVAPVRLLLDAGVVVVVGSDNVEDPFCPLGRPDPFDAARLLVLTTHVTPDEAWAAASTSARSVLGRPRADLAVGSVADLVAVEGPDLATALARGGVARTVVRAGRVVARTEVRTESSAGSGAGSSAGSGAGSPGELDLA